MERTEGWGRERDRQTTDWQRDGETDNRHADPWTGRWTQRAGQTEGLTDGQMVSPSAL